MATTLPRFVFLFLIGMTSAPAAPRESSDEWNRLTAEEQAAGWQLLWDGRTLNGWRGTEPAIAASERWQIAGGVLSVKATGPGVTRTHLVTEREYSAFELRFQFRITAAANSGVKYLVAIARNGDRLVPIGPEYQLLDDELHPDAKRGTDGNRTLGSLYDIVARRPGPIPLVGGAAVGNWQEAKIVVGPQGRVEHWLNGEKLLEIDRGSPDFKARVGKSAYGKFSGFGEAPAGPILLQDHGDLVSFRSLKVRALTPGAAVEAK